MKPRDQVVIDRATWRSGDDGEHATCYHQYGDHPMTRLLDKHGNMCCLGFACKQLAGLSDADILDACGPASVGPHAIRKLQYLRRNSAGGVKAVATKLTSEAMNINDHHELTREEREDKLIKIFRKNGVELKFTGEYSD